MQAVANGEGNNNPLDLSLRAISGAGAAVGNAVAWPFQQLNGALLAPAMDATGKAFNAAGANITTAVQSATEMTQKAAQMAGNAIPPLPDFMGTGGSPREATISNADNASEAPKAALPKPADVPAAAAAQAPPSKSRQVINSIADKRPRLSGSFGDAVHAAVMRCADAWSVARYGKPLDLWVAAPEAEGAVLPVAVESQVQQVLDGVTETMFVLACLLIALCFINLLHSFMLGSEYWYT